VVFAALTVLFSVVLFVIYNLALGAGALTNATFGQAGPEILREFPIALALQLLVAGPLSRRLAFRVVDPKAAPARLVGLTITFMTIALMAPMMSLASTLLYRGPSLELASQWLQALALNFPLAVFSQFFFVGPLVRWIFRALFRQHPAPPLAA